MMKLVASLVSAFLGATIVTTAWAADKPCAPIVDACKKAGYTQGSTSGKRLWKDCVKSIVEGKTVTDVTVPADADVKACGEKMAEKMKNMNMDK